MSLKGLMYEKSLSIYHSVMNHAPLNKYHSIELVSKRMGFDEVSPSGYNYKKSDKYGSDIDYTRYRTLELLALELHRKKSLVQLLN